MEINKFYNIADENTIPIDNFQLTSLGVDRISMIVGSYVRRDYGAKQPSSKKLYVKVTAEDYDKQLANKIYRIQPIYDIHKILDYHFMYFTKTNDDKELFIKQIRYVILPIIQKEKENDVHSELILDWVNEKQSPTKYSNLNITINSKMNKATKILIIGAAISVISALLWKLDFLEEPTSSLISAVVTLFVTYFVYKAEKNRENEKNEEVQTKNNGQTNNSKKVTITNTNIKSTSGDVIITGGDSITINSNKK
jgi:membrane protein implicated in regulation of membrane protease activity